VVPLLGPPLEKFKFISRSSLFKALRLDEGSVLTIELRRYTDHRRGKQKVNIQRKMYD